MKWLSSILCFVAVGCASLSHPPVVTQAEDVPKWIGRNVTLVGEVSNMKIPQILGVDVEPMEWNLRGKSRSSDRCLGAL
jgi:hypothetical protein